MTDLLRAIRIGGGSDRVQTLRYIRVGVLAIAVASLGVLLLVQPNLSVRSVGAITISALLFVVTGMMANRGAVRHASWTLILGLIVQIVVMSLEGGGMSSPGIRSLLVFVWITGVLLGEDAAIRVAIGCAAVTLLLAVLEYMGAVYGGVVYSPFSLWVLFCMYLGLTVLVMRLFAQSTARTLDQSARLLRDLEAALKRLDTVLDASGIGIWRFDAGARVYHGDANVHAMLGSTASPDDPVPEHAWVDIVHADDRAAVVANRDAAALRGEERQQRIRIQHGAGHWVVLDVTYAPDRTLTNGVGGVIGIVIDRTLEVRSEREVSRMAFTLRERVKELTVLYEWSRLLGSTVRLDETLVHRLAAAIPPAFLLPEATAVRIRIAGLTAQTDGFVEREPAIVQPVLSSNGNGDLTVVYIGGGAPDFDPFLEEERRMIGALAEMLGAFLERELAQRTRERAEQQLRQAGKMESLGTLAGGIAHDFNNILTAISTNIALARGFLPTDSEAVSALTEVDRTQLRAKDLVRRILLFSKQTGSELRAVGLAEIVDDVRLMLRSSLSRDAQLVVELEPKLPPIHADATQVHQALLNLATNAAHAMRSTGGTLTIRAQAVSAPVEPLVGGAVLPTGRYVRLDVVDTGSGIEPGIIERLFDPFFTTKGAEGTGLGLAVVYGVMREHHGGIAIESTVGTGTRFSLYFPQAQRDGAPEANDKVIVRGRGERILLVDDEAPITFAMSRLLASIGYACDPFNDSLAALQAFRTDPGRYDVAMLDVSMPELDGRDLARAILEIRPHFPVLLCSGYSGEALGLDESLREVTVIPKPIELSAVSRALSSRLRPT